MGEKYFAMFNKTLPFLYLGPELPQGVSQKNGKKNIFKEADSQRDQQQQGMRPPPHSPKKCNADFSFLCRGTKSFESNSLKEIDFLRCIFAAAYIFKNAIFLFNENGPFLIWTKKS